MAKRPQRKLTRGALLRAELARMGRGPPRHAVSLYVDPKELTEKILRWKDEEV